MMKQTKEQLLAENEKLKIAAEHYSEDIQLLDDEDKKKREILSKILGKRKDEIGFSPYSVGVDTIYTWMEIACEIGKLLEKAKEFDQTQEIKYIKDQLQFMYEKFENQNKQNENRN